MSYLLELIHFEKVYEDLIAVSEEVHVIATLIISCFAFLTVLNFYYLLRRIIFLNQKSFHLMMWTLLQLCYACALTASLLAYRACTTINGLNLKHPELFVKTLESLLKPGHEILVLIYISYAIDSLVHSIFAMKYWVLSRKF